MIAGITVLALFTWTYFFAVIAALIFFGNRIIKGDPIKRLFINYLKILGVCVLASAFPFLTFGLLLGLPSTLLASIVLTFIFRKELS